MPVVDTVVVIVSSRVWVFCLTNWPTVVGIAAGVPEEREMVDWAGKGSVAEEGEFPDDSLVLDRVGAGIEERRWSRHFV